MSILETATSYRRTGLCVLPAIATEKRPALSSWKPYQTRLPTDDELRAWFTDSQAMCLLAFAPLK